MTKKKADANSKFIPHNEGQTWTEKQKEFMVEKGLTMSTADCIAAIEKKFKVTRSPESIRSFKRTYRKKQANIKAATLSVNDNEIPAGGFRSEGIKDQVENHSEFETSNSPKEVAATIADREADVDDDFAKEQDVLSAIKKGFIAGEEAPFSESVVAAAREFLTLSPDQQQALAHATNPVSVETGESKQIKVRNILSNLDMHPEEGFKSAVDLLCELIGKECEEDITALLVMFVERGSESLEVYVEQFCGIQFNPTAQEQ